MWFVLVKKRIFLQGTVYHTQTAPTLHLAYSTLFSGPLFSDQIYPVVCTGFVFILSLVAWIYLVLVHNFSLWKFFLKTPKYHSILRHYRANLFNNLFSNLIYVDYPLWEFYFIPLCFWYDVLFKATEYPLRGYLFYPTALCGIKQKLSNTRTL